MKGCREALCLMATTLLLASCGSSETDGSNQSGPMGFSPTTTQPGTSGMPTQDEPAPPPTMQIHVGDQVLVSPSELQVAAAFYQIIGMEPPFDEWAKADQRARSANEFDRPAIVSRVQQELVLAAQAVAGVGYFQINTNSRFGEYDMTSQGFRLQALDSNRYYSWNYKSKTYKLTLENGNEAQLWKIPVEDAKVVVEMNNYRQVDLRMKIKIVGAVPDERGGILKGKIESYEVFDRHDGGRKLGEMAFTG